MTYKENPSARKSSALYYGYVIVAAAFIIILLSYGVRTSFGVFFKPIITEFDWSRGLTSGAVTLSMLLQGLWGIVMGRVNDRIGSRWVATLCCGLLGAGLMLMSLTSSSWHLYLFYGVIVGLGMGGIFVALLSTVARWFVNKRGLMTGVVMAGIGVGTMVIAPFSNWLIARWGWRLSCIILGGIIFVAGILIAQFLRRNAPTPAPAQQTQSLRQNAPAPAPAPQAPLSAAAPAQQTVKEAVPWGLSLQNAMQTSQFWILIVVFTCLGYCTFTVTVHLVPHITDLKISPASAAMVLALTGGIQSLGGIILGLAADKIRSKKVLVISLILITAPLFWLVTISSIQAFYIFAFLYSFGIGGGTAMESTLVAEQFGLRSHGVILGAISFGFTIGAAIGPFISGWLFDIRGNYQLAFLVCAATGVAGLVLTAFLKPSAERYYSRD